MIVKARQDLNPVFRGRQRNSLRCDINKVPLDDDPVAQRHEISTGPRSRSVKQRIDISEVCKKSSWWRRSIVEQEYNSRIDNVNVCTLSSDNDSSSIIFIVFSEVPNCLY